MFRDRAERLKRFGPLDNRHGRWRVGARRTFHCGQCHQLRFRRLKTLQVELQQPRLILPNQDAIKYLAVFWVQPGFGTQTFESSNDQLECCGRIQLMQATRDA